MTLAPPSRARCTKARKTPDLPIPAIPCRQITCVSPHRSSSRARSSASRPTKGTRRRWETAVAMTAVSTRAPPGTRTDSDGLDDHDRAACSAPSSDSPDRGCDQLSWEAGPSDAASERGGRLHAQLSRDARAATRPRTSRRQSTASSRTAAIQRLAVSMHPAPADGLPETFARRGTGACPRPSRRRPLGTSSARVGRRSMIGRFPERPAA
jgi:hypothetical protein